MPIFSSVGDKTSLSFQYIVSEAYGMFCMVCYVIKSLELKMQMGVIQNNLF